MKQTLLLIGCGDIALRSAALLRTHYRLIGLCRSLEKAFLLRQNGISPIIGDLDNPKTLYKLTGISNAVLHLAPPTNHGKRDIRTANLLASLTKRPAKRKLILPQQLIYISTSGVYGDCHGALIDETYPIKPQTERSIRRSDAEKQIRNWGLRNKVSVSIMRVPGIYAAERLPLKRLYNGSPVLLPEDDSYTNIIHADDLAHIIFAALRYAKPGRIYNVSDNSNLKMGEYFDLIADVYGIQHPPRISLVNADKNISSSMLSFMKESRRLLNIRIKNELKIRLRYPTVAEGLAAGKAANQENR